MALNFYAHQPTLVVIFQSYWSLNIFGGHNFVCLEMTFNKIKSDYVVQKVTVNDSVHQTSSQSHLAPTQELIWVMYKLSPV